MTVSFGGSFPGGKDRAEDPPCSCHPLGWEHLWERGSQHLRFDEDDVWSGGEAVLSWCEWFHKSDPVGDGGMGILPSRVGCVWYREGLAAALPIFPRPRRSKGTFEALQGFPGGGLGANSRLNLYKRRRRGVSQGSGGPFCWLGSPCSQADSHIA